MFLNFMLTILGVSLLVHLKQKKFTDTESLGITCPYLVRQPAIPH